MSDLCVSSPRVSKGCFGKAYVAAEGITFEAALAHAWATDTGSHPIEICYNELFFLEPEMKFLRRKGITKLDNIIGGGK